MKETVRIGCIGQGWIGKQYADDFESRGFAVTRYALEEPYCANKEKIAECEIVFIAVPTPTTIEGFDASIVRSVLRLVGVGNIAVIKSTLLPGTTEKLQIEFPDLTILHVPEFLREATAAKDVAEPERNIIGFTEDTDRTQRAARAVLAILPPAPFTTIVSSRAAELIKYSGNVFLALKVVYANILYDLAASLEVPYEPVREALAADSRIGASHLSPVAASGHSDNAGRGAGGHCFIKDLEAFRRLYESEVKDDAGRVFMDSLARKNNALLRESGKDLDLLTGVYGEAADLV
jgi:nucleotide sugar dehydrogenase